MRITYVQVWLTAGPKTFASDEGIPIGKGGTRWVVMSRHFYNPTQKAGVPDYGTGYRVIYTPTLRPKVWRRVELRVWFVLHHIVCLSMSDRKSAKFSSARAASTYQQKATCKGCVFAPLFVTFVARSLSSTSMPILLACNKKRCAHALAYLLKHTDTTICVGASGVRTHVRKTHRSYHRHRSVPAHAWARA